jgi:hypothetical protein
MAIFGNEGRLFFTSTNTFETQRNGGSGGENINHYFFLWLPPFLRISRFSLVQAAIGKYMSLFIVTIEYGAALYLISK